MKSSGTVKPAIEYLVKRNCFLGASLLATISWSLHRKRRVVVRFDGIDVLYKWSGGGICLEAYTKTPWSQVAASMDIFCRNYKPKLGDTLLDIGAGCGTEVSYFSTAVGNSGHVYAIEADPNVFRRLEKTITLIGAKNITALNLAVYSKSSNVWVNMVTSAGVGNFVSRAESNNSVEINGCTFDDLIVSLQLKVINFVKMNIEGAESEALLGLKEFSDTVINWCISCHDFLGDDYATFDFVYNWLEQNNYKVQHFPNSSEPYKNFYIYGAKS